MTHPGVAATARTLLAAGMACGLAACATYHAAPLSDKPQAANIPAAEVSATPMPTASLAAHRFDPSDGMDVTEVAMLAVTNSPHLRVMRDQLGINRAQAFDAGLLPDPQLSVSRDVPTSIGQDLTNAFGLGLSWDLGALLTRSAHVSAARASRRQVRLELLWAEWQTIARSRQLFDLMRYQQERQRRLQRELEAITPLARQIRQALQRGDLDYSAANTGLDAAAGIRRQLIDAKRQALQAQHDLHQLLGLAPDVSVTLVGKAWHSAPTAEQIDKALSDLVRRRPDLLALKAGYAAQEADVRAAILGQFPAIQVGVNRARDTSGVYTTGFSLGITLPLFNRNRGKIAITRATRKKMADSYRAQLLGTRNDVQRLRDALQFLQQQRAAVEQHARQLDAAATTATRNWRDGLLDWPTWLSIRSSALNADLDIFDLQQQQDTAALALETLLGGDWSDQQLHPDTSSMTPDHGS